MEIYLYYAVCFIIGMTISKVYSPSFKNIWVGLTVSLILSFTVIGWLNLTVMEGYF